MKRMAFLMVIVALAIGISAAQAGLTGPNAIPQEGYWSCQSVGNGNTIYFSQVFDANVSLNAVTRAFAEMLSIKYAYTSGGSCGMALKTGVTLEKLKTDHERYVTQLRQAGRTVIETGWEYSADSGVTSPIASPTPPAQPPSAAMSQASTTALPAYRCEYQVISNSGERTAYVSGIVTTATAQGQLTTAWQLYILKTYSPPGPRTGTCRRLAAGAAEQQGQVEAAEKTLTMSNARIFRVEWRP